MTAQLQDGNPHHPFIPYSFLSVVGIASGISKNQNLAFFNELSDISEAKIGPGVRPDLGKSDVRVQFCYHGCSKVIVRVRVQDHRSCGGPGPEPEQSLLNSHDNKTAHELYQLITQRPRTS